MEEEVEYVKTQGLLRDFPSLKLGGLLPEPKLKGDKLAQFLTQEWTMIMAPRESELQRETEIAHNRFYDRPARLGEELMLWDDLPPEKYSSPKTNVQGMA